MSDATRSRSSQISLRPSTPPADAQLGQFEFRFRLRFRIPFFFLLCVFFFFWFFQFQLFLYLLFFCRLYRLGPVKCVDSLRLSLAATPPRNLAWSTRVWPILVALARISLSYRSPICLYNFVFRTFEIWNYSISLISSWIRLDLRSFGLWRPLKWIVYD